MANKKYVMWNYIDTQKATIKVITDYKRLKKLENSYILENKSCNGAENHKIPKVIETLNWFEPAWNSLSKENQLILKEFYMNETLKSNAGVRLNLKLGYSERQIHRLKDKAMEELSFYLFGK